MLAERTESPTSSMATGKIITFTLKLHETSPALLPSIVVQSPVRRVNWLASDGGFFNATMSFPSDYPVNPPTVRFTSEVWHPNVYPDGKVCISILHPPGDDPNGYELATERWNPLHTVESIVLSIISMLSCPNDESPANVDAAKEWREERDEFRKKVRRCVRKSQEML